MAAEPVDNDSIGLAYNLGIGVGILLTVCVLFDILRYFFPKIYFYREEAGKLPENDDYDGVPMYCPPRPSNMPFGWVKPVLWYDEATFIKTHGLDAVMYIRWLRIQALMFSILSVYVLLVLIPLYSTSSNVILDKKTNRRAKVVGVQKLSLTNVKAQDNRLWGTLISELVVIALVGFFVRKEMHVHKTYRLAYRADSLRNPSNYAIMVLDVPPEHRTKDAIRRFFVRCLPGEVAEVHHIRDAEYLVIGKNKIISAVRAREKAQWRLIRATNKHPEGNHEKLEQAVLDAVKAQGVAERELEEMFEDLDDWCPLTHAAIVVFYSKRAATVAASTPLWNNASEWKVERAAEPKAVNWNRIEITSHTSLIRSLSTLLVVTAFTAFWFIPITGIQWLSNLEDLSKTRGLEFLKDIVNSRSVATQNFVRSVEGVLPPLILFGLLQLIPMLFRFVIGFERIADKGRFESKIKLHLFVFYVASNFFFVVITGSVLAKLAEMIEDPRKIMTLLGESVPDQSTFLMKYMLINSFLGSAIGLLNIGRLIFRPILMMGARTTRAKRGADAIFSEYPFCKMFALTQMISLIAIVYSTIAPLICVVAAIYFSIAYVTNKFIIMYSHRPFFEAGGHMYPSAWYSVLIALWMHQVVLVGVFTLKKALAQAIIAVLSISITFAITLYCLKSFFRIARHGSLVDQMDSDDRAGLIDRVPAHFPDLYIHPGFQEFEVEDLTGLPRELRSERMTMDQKTSSSVAEAIRKREHAAKIRISMERGTTGLSSSTRSELD